MKLLRSLVPLLLLMNPARADEKPAGRVHTVILKPGETAGLSVLSLESAVAHQDAEMSFPCAENTKFKLQFAEMLSLVVSCEPVYGGILKIHPGERANSEQALMVAEDWGDEGCLKRTHSELRFTKARRIEVITNTKKSGKLVDGSETDCNPGTQSTHYLFDLKSKKFKKLE